MASLAPATITPGPVQHRNMNRNCVHTVPLVVRVYQLRERFRLRENLPAHSLEPERVNNRVKSWGEVLDPPDRGTEVVLHQGVVERGVRQEVTQGGGNVLGQPRARVNTHQGQDCCCHDHLGLGCVLRLPHLSLSFTAEFEEREKGVGTSYNDDEEAYRVNSHAGPDDELHIVSRPIASDTLVSGHHVDSDVLGEDLLSQEAHYNDPGEKQHEDTPHVSNQSLALQRVPHGQDPLHPYHSYSGDSHLEERLHQEGGYLTPGSVVKDLVVPFLNQITCYI